MGFLITLLLVVLFFRVFVGISIGLVKLLVGIIVIIALIGLAPIGLLAFGLMIPIILLILLFAVVGFVLKLIF